MSDAKMIRPLSEYFSDNMKRRAVVMTHGWNEYLVQMYQEGELKESRVIEKHTLDYAEDCADNFVSYIGEFKQ